MPKAKASAALRKNGKERTDTNKNAAGRSTVMTPEVIAKLEGAFAQGFGDKDACILAGIDLTSLYRYNIKNPDFATKRENLKRRPLLASIILINNAIKDGDVATAKWYAERKGKDEFSTRNETTGKDGAPIQKEIIYIEAEEKEAYEKHIDSIVSKN